MRRKLAAWKAIGASPKLLRWIKEGVSIPFLHGPPQRYHQGISFTDMTPDQFEFMSKELPRLFQEGGMESGNCNGWVSRAFLVPKPPKADGTLCWRIVVDLRHLNLFCQKFRLKLETLKRLRYLGRPGDYCFSIDLQDGFYAMGLVPEDRAYMTFEIPQPLADSCGFKNTLVQLCGLPMGWTLSPYYFVKMMEPVFRYLRSPMFSDRNSHQRYRRHVLHLRRRGCRLLPFMDDILFLCSSRAVALELREQVVDLLERVGLSRNPKKGQWDPGQQIHHLGLDIDFQRCEFRAPKDKLAKISSQAHDLLCRAARNKRSVPVKELAQLAGRAQFLYLAIPAARFYLRELHDVMSTKTSWSGHVKVTRQLRRDLEWWRTVPQQRNGRPIFSPVETAYLHTDSSSFGWGAVLNDHREARGFWPRADLDEHITFKELKAVRLAVETFLPQLRCRRVLLHEDNQAVVAILTKLTSRSPALMNELRKLWHIMDENDITIRPRYIQSAANILGRSIKSGAGRCRLATPPSPVPAVGQAIPAHHRQVRLWGECPAATLQFEVVGAPDGSRRLPSAAGLPVARGKQFLPSAVGPARRLGAEAAEEWSRGDSRGAFMARSLLASAAHGDGFGDQSVSAQPRAVSASSSASTRWARASKVERRGLPSSMPAWVHLRDSQVGQQQPSLTSITIGSYRPATAPVNARYTLLPPRSEARYHQGIKPKLEAWLGTDTVGQVAMELVLQRHCATTASSYGTGVRSFLSFCAEYSIDPAAVDSSHIQRYIAWMGLRGTVKAASLRNYLSAVNSFLRDNDREPIAQGKMVSDSLRALAARQEDTIVSAHRAPLPASVALKIYNLAVQLIHSSKLCNMSLLRACCATIFSYFFFNRSGTTRGILNKDVASSGTDLLFYERHTKGKAGLDDAARTLYTAGHPQMAALMDHFTAIKSAYCASQQVALPLCYFALPGEDPASWTSNTQTEWLSMAYTAVGCSPPAGFAWTSHSLRSGAACAAQAEGWSDSDLCKYGGWVVGSAALQEAYLKVPVRPCTGSLFFFGWLKTRLHSGQPLPL